MNNLCTRIERYLTALSARCYVTQRAVENFSALQDMVSVVHSFFFEVFVAAFYKNSCDKHLKNDEICQMDNRNQAR